jgi:hypothetical protein
LSCAALLYGSKIEIAAPDGPPALDLLADSVPLAAAVGFAGVRGALAAFAPFSCPAVRAPPPAITALGAMI